MELLGLKKHLILSLFATGSRGHTREQLLLLLKSTSIEEIDSLSSQIVASASLYEGHNNFNGGPILSIVNGAWVDQGFILKPSFAGIVRGLDKAQVQEVDFQNKILTINNYKNRGLLYLIYVLASQLLLELPVRSGLIAKTLYQNKKSVTGLVHSDSALHNFS
ncbi:serpin-zx [Quercus suber]|uniref:Serpin-zx n=1 Tax=Quercus suber TaxID=58331 RepID=A0AAW0LEM5_QUESU